MFHGKTKTKTVEYVRTGLKLKTTDNVARLSSEFFSSDLVVVVKLSEVEYSRAFQLLPETSFLLSSAAEVCVLMRRLLFPEANLSDSIDWLCLNSNAAG